ncbi:uncharacterized protein Triagg1_1210 [Trichoderma aggressivum f. europaeum]|uniref:GPI inositol-deacylase n=1 Tax=Trichoderma aggressivum f. europaeum TaxID=173218 RepID=A0AAE1ILI9_9HYPO|nr:hypothetical protein Triagg1_1210 [Trichoderma aggressivum f. europaeum]
MENDSTTSALALKSTATELNPTLQSKANLEPTAKSTSRGQSLSDQTLANHDTTAPKHPPADTDQARGSSLGSFRAHLFAKFGRRHERPVSISRPKGPMGLNTLYDPGEIALVDVIFVHGLGGDSKKTWSGSRDAESYWPRDWLPNDPSFKTARIHSFGYDANWRDRNLSILSIHDFGQDLLGEMKNHPSIRRSKTNFILIGHSMGGNIAKAAYVLAKQGHDEIASRFHSIIFLGTPHRGSNLAKVARNILQVMGVSKPYLDDLSANSAYLTELNSLFQPYAEDLHIWSFFETRPVTERPAIVLVDKFSATLGYSHEEVLPLDADHRHICKFGAIEDPNYRKVRNALSRAVDMIQLKDEPYSVTASRARLEQYLNTDDSYQDDLFNCQNAKLPGSCVWFTEHIVFAEWLDFHKQPEISATPPILWLTGPPGAGKSIIFGHVVDFTRAKDACCEYYFFRKGQANSNGLGPFLLHMAYQMALNDTAVRRRIFKLQDNSISWQLHDEKSIWRKLFVDGIFQIRFKSPHYWLIDGLDECATVSAFFKLASQIPDAIRIFVTSRNTPEIERGISSIGSRAVPYHLSITDTAADIQAVIHTGLKLLSLHDITRLEPKLVEKASGSFLWIRLVLQELETAFTDEDVEEIINDIPYDLYQMYERILHTIQNERRRAKVAKSILFFVVLAVRPMTLDELCHAMQYELGQNLHKMDQVIMRACSQFVTINHRNRVQIVHETARDFFLSEGLDSPLAIPRCQGHSRFAGLCISYLEAQFQHPSGTSELGVNSAHQNATAFFLKYAATSFSQHLLEADNNSPKLFKSVVGFLNTKTLFWIEYLASESLVTVIPRTSIDLAHYINEEMHDLIPDRFRALKSWIIDLSRVVFTFRDQLLLDPSIIHDLIPQLCPTSSVISQSALLPPSTISVSGTRDPTWDDRLLRIPTDQEVHSVGYGEAHFAIGLHDGEIAVYDSASMQLHVSLVHPDSRASQLEFSNQDIHLVSLGRWTVSIWDVKTGSELHRIACSSPQRIHLESDDLHIVLEDGSVISRNFSTSESRSRKWLPSSTASKPWPWEEYRLQHVAFSQSSPNILAASFHTKDVYLFDIDGSDLLGTCCAHEDSIIRAMEFNPRHDILAISHVNGSLTAFDTRTMSRILMLPHVSAHVLNWSANGRHLIVGTQSAAAHKHTIEVYELGLDIDSINLSVIYRTNYPHKVISRISTAKDGLRFASIHLTECHIWDVSRSLYKFVNSRPVNKYNNTSLLDSQQPSTPETRGEISAMVLSQDGTTAICGNEHGEIWTFSTVDGSVISIIHRAPVPRVISRITVAERESEDLVIKCNWRGLVTILESSRSPSRWTKATVVAHYDLDRHMIEQLLVSPAQDRLLIMTTMNSTMLELPSGKLITYRDVPKYKTKIRAAHNCPSDSSRFIVFEDDSVHLLHWDDVESDKSQQLEILRQGDATSSQPTNTLHFQGNGIYVENLVFPLEGNKISCWNSSQFATSDDPVTITPYPGLQRLTNVLKDILFVFQTTLIFVDYNSWVCTLDLKTFPSTCVAKRHFFLLPEWTETYGRPMAALTPNQELVFVNLHRIVVVKNWFASVQTLILEPDSGDWQVISRRMKVGSAVLGKG